MKAAIATDCGHASSGHVQRKTHLLMAAFSFVFMVLITVAAASPAIAQKKDGSPQSSVQVKAGKKSGQKNSISQKKVIKKKVTKKKVVKKKGATKAASKKASEKKAGSQKSNAKGAKKTASAKNKTKNSATKNASSRQSAKKKTASKKNVTKKKSGSRKAAASNKKTRNQKTAAKKRKENAAKRGGKKSASRKKASERNSAKKRVKIKSANRNRASARKKTIARKRSAARKSRVARARRGNIYRYSAPRRYPAPRRRDALAAIIEGAAFAIAIQNDHKLVRPRPVPLPPRPFYPRRRAAVDADQATAYELEQALTAPPPVPVERTYSLEEMRGNGDWHGRLNRVDLKSITFATGSAQIENYEISKLADIARVMHKIIANNPEETFMISGHTDLVGDALYNLELSDRRARSIAAALTQFYAMPPQNLVTQGYGEQYPVIPSPYAERENRRVSVQRITPLLRNSQYQPSGVALQPR